jgi:hypothetical protein
MKGAIHHEEISIHNTYAPNTGHPSTLKKKKEKKKLSWPSEHR